MQYLHLPRLEPLEIRLVLSVLPAASLAECGSVAAVSSGQYWTSEVGLRLDDTAREVCVRSVALLPCVLSCQCYTCLVWHLFVL